MELPLAFQKVMAIFLMFFKFVISQEINEEPTILCPGENLLRCDNNKYVHIELIEIVSNSRDCNTGCSELLSDDDAYLISASCERLSSCELDFDAITSLKPNAHFDCPRTGGPPSHSNGRGPPDNTYSVRVQYDCKEHSDTDHLTIPEGNVVRRKLSSGKTLEILSPSYPTMSTDSQDVSCVFTRSQPVDENSPKTTVLFELRELELYGPDSTEELTVTPDSNKGTRDAYSGPITITEQADVKINLKITENFTVHFNRCTTLKDGGKFKMAVKVESEFEVTCTHVFTKCQQAVVLPPDLDPNTEGSTPAPENSNVGVIIGGIIGGLLLLIILLVIIIVALLFIMRKRKKQNLPVQKRENKPPVVARYSSYADRASNVYQEIRDSEFYSEIGHVNSVLKNHLDYEDRPAPELPKERDTEPGYDKIKENRHDDVDIEMGKVGNDYSTPAAQNVSEKSKDTTEDENGNCNHNSYLSLMDSGDYSGYSKPQVLPYAKEDYAKPNKRRMKDKEDSDEGVDVGSQGVNLNRLDSEVLMEDNTDLYNIGKDETDSADENMTEPGNVFKE